MVCVKCRQNGCEKPGLGGGSGQVSSLFLALGGSLKLWRVKVREDGPGMLLSAPGEKSVPPSSVCILLGLAQALTAGPVHGRKLDWYQRVALTLSV